MMTIIFNSSKLHLLYLDFVFYFEFSYELVIILCSMTLHIPACLVDMFQMSGQR